MERLYIVVRNDISPGLQIAQSCHAMREFAALYPELDAAWHAGSDNIVVVSCDDESELTEICVELAQNGVPIARFFEPDLGGQMTAIAAADGAKRHLRRLPLALAA